MKVVVHFHDALDGPPTSWVPLHASRSPNPCRARMSLPTSLWRGEGITRGGVGLLSLLSSLSSVAMVVSSSACRCSLCQCRIPSLLCAFLCRHCILELLCDSHIQGGPWHDHGGGNMAGGCCVGVCVISMHQGGMGGRKRTTTFIVVRYGDILDGPPILWVPPHVNLPPFLRCTRISHPHPFGKGRGDCGFILASEVG